MRYSRPVFPRRRWRGALLIVVGCIFLGVGPGSAVAQSPAPVLASLRVASGLAHPVFVTAPTNDPRVFIVEQDGLIRVVSAGALLPSPFLNASNLTNDSGERGLLGLAFAPNYATSGLFYINYTNNQNDTRVARYLVDPANPDRALSDSASLVLSVDQPHGNHNGGHLEFGPDDMLYVGLGDGGGSGDPSNSAQNDQSFLGKMLRLDVSGASGYTILDSYHVILDNANYYVTLGYIDQTATQPAQLQAAVEFRHDYATGSMPGDNIVRLTTYD